MRMWLFIYFGLALTCEYVLERDLLVFVRLCLVSCFSFHVSERGNPVDTSCSDPRESV